MKTKITDDYVPFGPEWEKELMKMPKKFIIDLYRTQCKRVQAFAELLKINNTLNNGI